MRIRLTNSLLSLVVICCVASLPARAQDVTRLPVSPKKKPASASQVKRKPAPKSLMSEPTATNTTATPAPAKPAATTAATAARRAAAKRAAAAKAAGAKGGGEAAQDSAGAADAEKQSQPKPRRPRPKAAKPVAEADAAEAPAEKSPTDSANTTDTKPATDAKSDAAATTKNDAAAKPVAASKTARSQAAKGQKNDAAKTEAVAFDPAKEAELKAKLEELLQLPAWERIAELQDFLDQDLPDALADRAAEHLVSAQAAYGDERLQSGDVVRGVELFQQAVAAASEDVSDKLYFDVVSQLPANLVLRGQPAAAFELARKIEPAAKGDAKRLLALAAFYLTAEHTADAARLAARAAKLAPDLAAAHQALAAAARLSLHLDESAAEYARAAELDPKSVAARHSVADLRRATGKPEEALAIYRELLAADATDRAARDGVVLALFDAGRREEAGRELEAALKDEPRDLPLLAGAAYWYAAHGDAKRALDLSGQAVQIEPRYPWAQVAFARSLVANNHAADAERSLRFARIYSHFATLDYELANALAANGLYAEESDELAGAFSLKGDQLETRLAGVVEARAPNFVELLAPERRASLFAYDAADTQANARTLKALLALSVALKSAETRAQRAAVETAAAAAAREFAAGDDPMRAFRQLYAADRLLRRGVASRTALELLESAKDGVDAAISTPQATIAITADDLREMRASAINQGGTPNLPTLPREMLDAFVRGRIEELTGRALLDEGKPAEAVAALRRAVGMLPENSLFWHNALWRLGTALAVNGAPQEALNTYIRSYTTGEPDPARRAVIELLYRKLNGSLAGLDVLLGSAPPPMRLPPPTKATTAVEPAPPEGAKSDTTKSDATKSGTTKSDEAGAARAEDAHAAATPEKIPAERSDSEAKRVETKPAETTPSEVKGEEAKKEETKKEEAKKEEAKDAPTAEASTPATEVKPEPTPVAPASPTPEPSTETPTERKKADDKQLGEKKGNGRTVEDRKVEDKSADKRADDAAAAKPVGERSAAQTRRARPASGDCALAVSSDALTLDGGGSASVVATLDGGADASKVTATTPNWSDIIVLREPPTSADASAVKFTVTSISKGGGTFAVTIKSPCGAKQLSVTVK
ncbi:MAG: hypothetical protein ACJ741_07855 [Pyrinomonadaceae bacterium]